MTILIQQRFEENSLEKLIKTCEQCDHLDRIIEIGTYSLTIQCNLCGKTKIAYDQIQSKKCKKHRMKNFLENLYMIE